MLAPQSNASRTILDFSGIWDFRLKPDTPWQSIEIGRASCRERV